MSKMDSPNDNEPGSPALAGYEDRSAVYLLRKISNRLAKVEALVIDMQEDRESYRKEREVKEANTLDIIKKEIQLASDARDLKSWALVKDRALYVGIALFVAWAVQQFIK